MNVTVNFAALFIQRTEPFVEPGRACGKVNLDEGVHNLMNQSPAAGRDVHDERLVGARIIAIWRAWLLAEQRQSVPLVGSSISKQPDVEDLFRIFRKEI